MGSRPKSCGDMAVGEWEEIGRGGTAVSLWVGHKGSTVVMNSGPSQKYLFWGVKRLLCYQSQVNDYLYLMCPSIFNKNDYCTWRVTDSMYFLE